MAMPVREIRSTLAEKEQTLQDWEHGFVLFWFVLIGSPREMHGSRELFLPFLSPPSPVSLGELFSLIANFFDVCGISRCCWGKLTESHWLL